MNITKVQVYPGNSFTDKSGFRLVAYAAVVLENMWVVSHIRVVEDPSGSRKVVMPSVKNRLGKYQDVAYPINEAARSVVREKVLDAVDRNEWSVPIGGTDAE